MAQDCAEYILRVMAGEARGAGPAVLRAALCAGEALYAPLMAARNLAYQRGILPVHRLPRPVISVGNITAGGTGKTPVVRWLAERLRAMGRRPAILLRGYKSAGGLSDEQAMLEALLAGQPPIPVRANSDRFAGGREVLLEHPDVDVFILDDAFQHRRLGRDVDLVLVDATSPFGYGHVHPRGLLREPLGGLARASAIIITRSDQASAEAIADIERAVRRFSPSAPICRARHVHTGLRTAGTPASCSPDLPLASLGGKRYIAVAGIASPRSLENQLAKLPGELVGCRWYPDHHAYTADDLAQGQAIAAAAAADAIAVTEKDWPKLAPLLAGRPAGIPFLRLELAIEFAGDGEAAMVELLERCGVLKHTLHVRPTA